MGELSKADADKVANKVSAIEAKKTPMEQKKTTRFDEGMKQKSAISGGTVKFSTFEARMNDKGEIVISRDRDVRDEFGKETTKKTEIAMPEEKFRAMAKQFGADPDALLAKMRGNLHGRHSGAWRKRSQGHGRDGQGTPRARRWQGRVRQGNEIP